MSYLGIGIGKAEIARKIERLIQRRARRRLEGLVNLQRQLDDETGLGQAVADGIDHVATHIGDYALITRATDIDDDIRKRNDDRFELTKGCPVAVEAVHLVDHGHGADADGVCRGIEAPVKRPVGSGGRLAQVTGRLMAGGSGGIFVCVRISWPPPARADSIIIKKPPFPDDFAVIGRFSVAIGQTFRMTHTVKTLFSNV